MIDNGTAPVCIGGPAPAGGGRINVDAKGRVLACQWRSGRAGLWRYDPTTSAWTRLLDEYYAYECVSDPADAERLILVTADDPFHDHATGTGVWVSHDGGKGWSPANTELPMIRARAAAFDPFDRSRVVIGTYGRGFFTSRWPLAHKPAATKRYVSTAEDAASVSLATWQAAQRPDRVRNGAMLEPGAVEGGPPAGWDDKFVAKGRIDVSRDTTAFKSSPASLRVKTSGGPAEGQANQMFDAAPGERIRVSGALKTAGDV